MKKKLLVGIAIVLVLFGIGFTFGKDVLLRIGIESGATAAAGTATTLDAAALSLFTGRLTLDDFELDNPPGFDTKFAFKVGRMDIDTQVTSLLGDTVKIDHIIIESPEIALEVGAGYSNIGKLLGHLRPGTGKAATESETETETETESGDPIPSVERDLEVGLVRIVNPRVTLSQSVVGSSQREFTLNTIELNELGTSGRPRATTFSGLIEQVLTAVVASACQHPDVPPQVAAVLNGELPYLENISAEVEKGIGGVVEKGLQGDVEGAKDAAKKLQGLIPGKKKD